MKTEIPALLRQREEPEADSLAGGVYSLTSTLPTGCRLLRTTAGAYGDGWQP
ncbi:hypothetical protein thsps117_31160 [Pseudomonas sp. No.117]